MLSTKRREVRCRLLACVAGYTESLVSLSWMEAAVARCLSGLDPIDLLGGDKEAVHDFISTFFC